MDACRNRESSYFAFYWDAQSLSHITCPHLCSLLPHAHTHSPAHTTLFHARTHMHTDSLVRPCTRSALHIQLQGTHTVDPFNGTNTNSSPNTRTQTHHVAPWVVSSKNIHHHVCSITRRHCGNKRGGGLDSMKSAERFDGSCLKCAWN